MAGKMIEGNGFDPAAGNICQAEGEELEDWLKIFVSVAR